MDKFLGTFKKIPDSVAGFDEHAKAMKIPKAMAQGMDNTKEGLLVITQNGDTYTMLSNDLKGKEEKFSFKLDEPFTGTTDDGMPTQSVIRMDGDHLVGERQFDTFMGSTRCYFEGDKMIMEVSGKGASMAFTYSRV